MFSKEEAQRHCDNLKEINRKSYVIFQIPATADSQQYPRNIYNTGNWGYCEACEKEDYKAHGAIFLDD